MATRKKNPETVSCFGKIWSWRSDSHVHVDTHVRGALACRKGSRYLEIQGEFDQPLNGVRAVSILTYPAEQPKVSEMPTPAIGSFIRLKPSAQAAVELALDEFDLLTRPAVNDKLRSFHIVFEKPYRGHALIAGISFSSGEIE